jgi:N-formylmaleamate deformylase
MNIPGRSVEDVYVKGMDAQIHLISQGDKCGAPVIFIPGITSYSYSFLDVLNRMPDEFHSLVMDVRGRGETKGPTNGYRLNDYVEDLLNVVNAFISNPVPPFIVGHSMGARIATAFASRYSSLLSGIVLIDPPINGPGQREKYPNSLEMFLEQKEAADKGNMEQFKGFFPSFNEAQIIERFKEYRNTSREALLESYESLLKEPFQVYLKMTSCPTLLLAAQLGDTIRDDELDVLKRINANLETIRMDGVGHMIYKEAPDRTVSYVLKFINNILK